MAKQRKGRKPTDAARRRTFLKALEEGAVVSRAARTANIATSTLYGWRQRMPEFRKDWAAALDVALDELEGALVRRAIEGVAKPIVYGGKEVATVQQYSDALAMFLLRSKRPEIYDRERAVQNGEFVDDGDETADIIAERLRLLGYDPDHLEI
jgi:hypothetical protein